MSTTFERFVPPGGSGKAEGFADGEWTNHRQARACRCHLGLDDALRHLLSLDALLQVRMDGIGELLRRSAKRKRR